MSAIIVLFIRILMVASIYGFLGFAFFALWHELKKTTEQQAATAQPSLSINVEGKENLQFSKPEIFLGRSAENDIQIIDETVSQQHARIFYLNNNWMLEDNQSTNGTFLNGEIIHSQTVLIEKDRIDIGNKTLIVSFSKDHSSA
jgi:pSer/pThr/pTyr-binding forkhead associated (FHA) protein